MESLLSGVFVCLDTDGQSRGRFRSTSNEIEGEVEVSSTYPLPFEQGKSYTLTIMQVSSSHEEKP